MEVQEEGMGVEEEFVLIDGENKSAMDLKQKPKVWRKSECTIILVTSSS